jgi:hypothetical protein
VFAIALEDYREGMTTLQAEINQEKAKQLHSQNKEVEGTTDPSSLVEIKETFSSSFVRGVIATCIAVGALSFVLYSFRVTIGNAVVSIGRNPRARGAIMMLSIGNIIFALFLCGVALFVAIAVLVLPL